MSTDLPEIFKLHDGPTEGTASDRDEGWSAFLRLNDRARLQLTIDLLAAAFGGVALNAAAVGGALRGAWDSEPYLDGVRFGSFISAARRAAKGEVIWTMSGIARTWGDWMMTESERRRLEGLACPLTVYRGGIGDPEPLSLGVSWTTDLETARFYAETWPARWGLPGPGSIIAMHIDRNAVAALFDDRSEGEVLVPDDDPAGRVFELVPLARS